MPFSDTGNSPRNFPRGAGNYGAAIQAGAARVPRATAILATKNGGLEAWMLITANRKLKTAVMYATRSARGTPRMLCRPSRAAWPHLTEAAARRSVFGACARPASCPLARRGVIV